MLADIYSMADYSTTVRGIPIRIAGVHWAPRQLHAGIRYVPMLSILMELQAGIHQISMAHFLPNRLRYSDSFRGRSLGSTSATRGYKVRLCCIKTENFAGFCGGGLECWLIFTR